MKGLLLKDFYMLKEYCKSYLFILIVFLGISIFQKESVFFILYPILISSTIPMTLLTYDEREKWDRYSAALPYTKAQIVSGKYIMGLLVTSVVFLLTALTQILKALYFGDFNIKEYLPLCELLLIIGIFAPIIILPFSFKWGTEKARILNFACILVIAAVSSGLIIGEQELTSYIPNFSINPAALLIAIALYLISWRLSIFFYTKREL